jgi:hypothetical protein
LNGWCCALDYPFCGTGTDVGYCFQCPTEVALDNDEAKLAVLREMRDARMSGSCLGKSLIDLYYEQAEEVSEILSANENLKSMTANVVGEIAEKAAQLNNNGGVGIDLELVKGILELADEINVNASPELKKAIKKVKQEIKRGDLFRQMGIKVE